MTVFLNTQNSCKWLPSEIKHFEKTHNVTVIGIADNGSKAWGYSCETSDNDLKAVFIHNDKRKYLNLFQYEDSYRSQNKLLNFDITYYDISKFMGFIFKGNAQGYETLYSDIQYVENEYYSMLQSWARSKYIQNKKELGYHYYGLAQSTYKRRVEEKKDIKKHHQWLYIIRPILSVIDMMENNNLPKLNFDVLLNSVHLKDENILKIINYIVSTKKSGINMTLPDEDNIMLSEWIEENIDYIKDFLDTHESSEKNIELEKKEYSSFLTSLINSV